MNYLIRRYGDRRFIHPRTIIAVTGAVSAGIVTENRITYAMAAGHAVFRHPRRIRPEFQVPYR